MQSRSERESDAEVSAASAATRVRPFSGMDINAAGNLAVGRLLAGSDGAQGLPGFARGRGAPAVIQREPAGGTALMVPPSTTSPQVKHSTGVMFTDQPDFVRTQLMGYVHQHGLDSLANFESGLITTDAGFGSASLVPGIGGGGAEVTPDYVAKVTTVVHEQVVTLRADIDQFRQDFQRRANDMLITMLAESEQRVHDQFTKYGVTSDATTAFGYTIWTSYQGGDNDQAKQLAAAVEPLKAKLLVAEQAKAEFDTVTESNMKSSTPNPAALEAAHAKFAAAQRDYDTARGQAETAHPVLQAYNLDAHRLETRGKLDQLTSEAGRAGIIGGELTTELKNIDKVRAAAAENPEYVWKLERLAGVTKELPDIANYPKLPNREMQSLVVAEKSADVKMGEELIQLASGVVLAALSAIAAIPTGGLSVAGAAAVGASGVAATGMEVALAYQQYQDYSLDSAAAGTDYERARLLSNDVPELFWLALNIIGAALSVAEAAKTAHDTFRRIVQLRKEAMIQKAALAKAETIGDEGVAATVPDAGRTAEAATLPNAGATQDAATLPNAQPAGGGTVRMAAGDPFGPTGTARMAAAPPQNLGPTPTGTVRMAPGQGPTGTVRMAAADARQSYQKAVEDLEAAGNQASPGAGARLRAEMEAMPATPWQLSQDEHEMLQHRVVDAKPLGEESSQGVNATYKSTLDDGTLVAYKPTSGVSTIARDGMTQAGVTAREVATSRADEMLKLDLVPTTTFTDGPHGAGSSQKWMSGTTGGQVAENYHAVEQERMAVLDYVTGNTDRHMGNYLTGPRGELVAIDHGFAFPSPDMPFPVRSDFVKQHLGKDLSPQVLAKVRAVRAEDFRAMLVQTGVDAPSAEAAMRRLQEIQQNGKITGANHAGIIGGGYEDMLDWQVRNDPEMAKLLIRPGAK